METIRLILHNNQPSSTSGKSILLNKTLSFPSILSACSATLGSTYSKIFNETGESIYSLSGLKDGSNLYLSQGESFFKHSQKTQTESVFALLGSAGVGKSAITLRYIRNLFVSEYDPTIEDFYKYITILNGETHYVSILDTAGMEDYEPLVEEWIERKQAIFLVFSLDIEDSFEKIEYFYRRVVNKYKKGEMPVVVIVGNKCDLDRKVDRGEVERYVEKTGCRYFEVSASTGVGIKEMFNEVLLMVKFKRKPILPWYRRCSIL